MTDTLTATKAPKAKKEMDPQLAFFLREQPTNAKELARLMGKSESRMREILKDHIDEIQCKKHPVTNVNIYSLPPVDQAPALDQAAIDDFEPTRSELEAQTIRPKRDDADEPAEVPVTEPAELPETTPEDPAPAETVTEELVTPGTEDDCPFCGGGNLDQDPSGPEGTFLGGCRTCRECKRTYNAFTKVEIKNAPSVAAKGKRRPIQSQAKINEKVAAVKETGGNLVYNRSTRKWDLTLPGPNGPTVQEMTAHEFALETTESIVKK